MPGKILIIFYASGKKHISLGYVLCTKIYSFFETANKLFIIFIERPCKRLTCVSGIGAPVPYIFSGFIIFLLILITMPEYHCNYSSNSFWPV